jgi:hypothetical protein
LDGKWVEKTPSHLSGAGIQVKVQFFDVTEMHTFVPIACLSNPRYLGGIIMSEI